jgi:hypothetical protein
MDSWAHNEATNVTKMPNFHYDMWGHLLEGSGGPKLHRGVTWPPLGHPTVTFPPFNSYTCKKRSHTWGGGPTNDWGLGDHLWWLNQPILTPPPLCMEPCNQVILTLQFMAVSSKGREGMSHGLLTWRWSSPYSTTTINRGVPPHSQDTKELLILHFL